MEEKVTNINDLPDEILEFIFSHMPPYKHLEYCALVCKRWSQIVKNVRWHTALNFNKGLTDFRLCWKPWNNVEVTPTIAGRFSHSAVVYNNSMYVFGGGSSTATTFNDLWRFDLSSRQWVRPISMGTYPSPKACATMVCYNNSLILFGGWRHPSTTIPYQTWRLFDELHAYSIADNKWKVLTTIDGPPPMTGHSATVHRNSMIVFGGYSQTEGTATSSNDVWSLDLLMYTWTKKETNPLKPSPRYGQSQIYLDETHCLVVGGCGGPNNMFSDAWVLDMTDDEIWKWKPLTIKNKKWAATHMWCNPACKVGTKLVVLGPVASAASDFQMVRHQVLPNANRNIYRPNNNDNNNINNNQPAGLMQQQPANNIPRQVANHQQPSTSRNHNGDLQSRRNNEDRAQANNNRNNLANNRANNTAEEPNRAQNNNNINININMINNNNNNVEDDAINRLQRNLQLRSRRHENDDYNLPKRFGESAAPMHDRIAMAAFNVAPDPHPNSTSPRERRLESLRRMEEKIQAMRQVNQQPEPIDEVVLPVKRIKRNCIGMFVCDISNALLPYDPYLEWLEHKNFGMISDAPERLILSSLVTGNGELIMFGGLRKESLSKSVDTTLQVSNSMHFLRVPRDII